MADSLTAWCKQINCHLIFFKFFWGKVSVFGLAHVLVWLLNDGASGLKTCNLLDKATLQIPDPEKQNEASYGTRVCSRPEPAASTLKCAGPVSCTGAASVLPAPSPADGVRGDVVSAGCFRGSGSRGWEG